MQTMNFRFSRLPFCGAENVDDETFRIEQRYLKAFRLT